jgi:hypothetical protein
MHCQASSTSPRRSSVSMASTSTSTTQMIGVTSTTRCTVSTCGVSSPSSTTSSYQMSVVNGSTYPPKISGAIPQCPEKEGGSVYYTRSLPDYFYSIPSPSPRLFLFLYLRNNYVHFISDLSEHRTSPTLLHKKTILFMDGLFYISHSSLYTH